jgi:hypothetical protein
MKSTILLLLSLSSIGGNHLEHTSMYDSELDKHVPVIKVGLKAVHNVDHYSTEKMTQMFGNHHND